MAERRRASPIRVGRRWKAAFEALESRQLLVGDLVISEFMASNDNGIRDQDQQRSDWIEVVNAGDTAINLQGWFLTDDADDLDKWEFPQLNVGPGRRILVFASGKNRAQPDGELHTNFRLDIEGEYLALVRPDGVSVAFEISPQYPPQLPDVSFGNPQQVHAGEIVVPSAPGRLLVPTTDNGGDLLGTNWIDPDFDDSAWIGGVVGIGYEQNSGYEDLIGTDVGTAMYDINRTAYLRYPFLLDRADNVFAVTLSMQYDDGYVAYINGQEVAHRNAPDALAWDSGATDAHRDRDAVKPEAVQIDVGQYANLLRSGKNVLSIHALNDDIVSSDFLLIPQLTVSVSEELRMAEYQYFAVPSPGVPNDLGSTSALISVSHQPNVPGVNDPLTVTATTMSTGGQISAATLYYRVMFDPEASVPMYDDGLHADGLAGDGTFAATLPAQLAEPGQMIRYRVTVGDGTENVARSPVYSDPLNTQQYYGTVVDDPSIQSQLPVIHLFLEDPAAADVQPGTQGAMFHNGKFYDNIEVDPTGRTVGLAGPKKSHDVFATSDHWFEIADSQLLMNDFDIISDFWNREKFRVPLGYETFRNIGTPAHTSFPVRVQQNGEFYATYFFVDGGNERFLERSGLDPRGALYKMNLGFSIGQGTFKKQTRTYEDISDLRDLFAGLALTGADRAQYLWDNVDIPAMVNYLVGMVIMAHCDCCGKNLYIYRDSEGTGQWQALPWDVDSAFGRGGVGLAQSIFPEAGGIFSGRDNLLIASLFDYVPGFPEMYLRRLRSLMDEFLQPPGTPAEELKFERRIDQVVAQIAPDAQLDFQKWGSWSADPVTGKITYASEGVPTWEEEVAIVRDVYLPARRVYLYNSLTQANGGTVLEPQQGAPPIGFGQIDYSPVSTNQDEEYIQLTNPNDVAVDVSGWRFIGGVQHTFHPGTVIPAGGSLFVSPNINAFRARATGPSGGQGLFAQGNYHGHLSNHGATVQLVALDGTVVDQLETPSDPLPVQKYLRISEIMYHPQEQQPAGRFAKDDFEYIELVNTSTTETIDLKNIALSQGVEFRFAPMSLAPNQRVVVVQDQAAFAQRYGSEISIAGEYGGTIDDFRLSNSGEAIRLEIASGDLIQEFAFDDDWFPSTDGTGYSLTVVDPNADLDRWNLADGWRPSDQLGGTPASASAINGDFNGDRAVDLADIELFAAALRFGDVRFDLTNDAIVDQVDLAFLIQNLIRTNFGDANLDGTFNSGDLVQVFQSGEYEDDSPGNSTWADGDWNGDGEFTTSDLVVAFQYGDYLATARPIARSLQKLAR